VAICGDPGEARKPLILWYHVHMESKPIMPRIALQSRVVAELVDNSGEAEQREFTLVTGKQADFKSGLLDENTPLGMALLGHSAGEVIPYAVGDLREVRILSVTSGDGSFPPDAARKRRAAVQKAEAQSEITNQMIFSTASGSKWGDYDVDVDKLLKDDEDDETTPESGT
jgi:hypothetical protein